VVALAIYPTGGRAQDAEPSAGELTAVEFQRRLQICLEAEDWLRAACLDALRSLDLGPLSPTENVATLDQPQTQPEVAQTVDELHMVGIYEPRIEATNIGAVLRGVVDVTVDRPGKTVALVLNSYEPVLWAVVATPGTQVARIIVSGHGLERTEPVSHL
jgi:hypothetical protein